MKKLLGIVLVFVCAAAFAQGPKIAVIDMAKVFQNYEKTKINELKLKQQAEVFKDYTTRLTESLEKLKQEFTTLRNASQNIVLTEAERKNKTLAAQDKYIQVQAKSNELRDYNREKQAQLREAYDNMRSAILKEIHQAVRNKCMLEGYTLVLDQSGMNLNNISTVVYYEPSMDITEAVLTELNRGLLGTPQPEGTDNKTTQEQKGK